MKIEINKTKRFATIFSIALLMFVTFSCDIEEIPNPNAGDLVDIENNATEGDLKTLASGVESLMRDEIGFYYDVLGIVGREWYFFTNSDPRYTGEILGKGASTLDEAGFYGTRPYAGRYRVIKNANILITAVGNTTASLTPEQENGYLGFAKTAQAYSMLLALNMQYQNGIRTDVADPDNLGPFLTYNDALSAIEGLLNEANNHLTSAGSSFQFTLSSAFAGFDTPATFAQFNRGIAARVAIYQGNKSGALGLLGNSFLDLGGDINTGPAHFYSVAGGDLVNLVFRTPDQSEALVAHPSFNTDILPGDDRINKIALRSSTAVLDGLSSDYDVVLYSGLGSSIPIMRNEELILLYAEANIGTDNTEAVNALNIIRSAHGLTDYAGGTTDNELVDELLYNRRFSLFGEAHRWVDMRRYDRLDQLPLDRPDDDVWDQFPRPVSENQ